MKQDLTKYNLPKGWIWTTIEHLGVVTSGGTPSTKESRYWNGNIPWISPADLSGYQDKYISKGKKSITKEGLDESSAKLLPKGSILFSSRAPIGYVAITKNDLATNQGFKNLIPAKSLNKDYFYYYLKSIKQLAERVASGTTFLELSAAKFSKLPVPLPPLNEQARIAIKLEELFSELDHSIANLKLAQAQLNVYRQAILKHVFEGKLTKNWREENTPETTKKLLKRIKEERKIKYRQKFKNWKKTVLAWEKERSNERKPIKPRKLKPFQESKNYNFPPNWNKIPDWLYTRVGNICNVKGGKRLPKGAKYSNETTPYPYLRVTDFDEFKINTENLKFISQETHNQINNYIINKEDAYISIAGSIGITGVIQHTLDGANLTENAAKFSDLILTNNKYLAYLMASELCQYQIRLRTKATSQPKLALFRIEEIEIPIPSFLEQLEIIAWLDSQFSVIKNLEKIINNGIIKAISSKQSILKKAFKGKLVQQDLSDEPAEIFLKRIQKEKKEYLIKEKTQKSADKSVVKKRRSMVPELKTIINILKENNEPIATKKVWENSIYKDDIDNFYGALKEHIENGSVVELPRRGLNSYLKLSDEK